MWSHGTWFGVYVTVFVGARCFWFDFYFTVKFRMEYIIQELNEYLKHLSWRFHFSFSNPEHPSY